MEHRYESDQTPKEKWENEKKKVKGMAFGERIDYIWTYYKVWLIPVAAVVLCIMVGVSMYQKSQENPILVMSIVDCKEDKKMEVVELEKELLDYLGTGEKHEKVQIDTTTTSGTDYNAVIKTSIALSGVEGNDLVVCNKELYEKYNKQEAFSDWKTFLGDKYQQYESYMTDGIIDLSKSEKWNKAGYTSYTPTYLGVYQNATHKEEVIKVLAYYFG